MSIRSRATLYFVAGLAAAAATAKGDTARAGPWTKDPGSFYAKVGQGLFLGSGFRSASSGTLERNTDYTGTTTSAYIEAGVAPRVHLQAYLPYTYARNTRRSDGATDRHRGGGDALLALQSSPIDLSFPTALRLEAKIPLYDDATTLHSGSALKPSLGDGQLDVTLWASAGAPLSLGKPAYVFVELGYQHRTEVGLDVPGRKFSDGIAVAAQAGVELHERVRIAVGSYGIVPFQSDGVTKGYLTVGPAVAIMLYRGLAMELSWDRVVYATQSAPGYSLSAGLSYAHEAR